MTSKKLSTFNANDSLLYRGNIENFIGTSIVPTGIIGPLKVNCTSGTKDYYIPMATTEGSLVASYNRGARLLTESEGVYSRCIDSSTQRAPGFKFKSIEDAIHFDKWIKDNSETFKTITANTSAHAKLKNLSSFINGYHFTLNLDFYTQDASGQNMVTKCTQNICNYIEHNSPIKPEYWVIESNYSGDKKASFLSLYRTRGKKVIAEAVIERSKLYHYMKVTPEQMINFYKVSTLNNIQSGCIGTSGHFANALAAIFIACGQDVACVGEASSGIIFGDIEENGDLYVSVTLPNLIVGTIGGGTDLPTQKECLSLMECYGPDNSEKFAELIAATIIAGEVSIAASICSNELTKSHMIFGRERKIKNQLPG